MSVTGRSYGDDESPQEGIACWWEVCESCSAAVQGMGANAGNGANATEVEAFERGLRARKEEMKSGKWGGGEGDGARERTGTERGKGRVRETERDGGNQTRRKNEGNG